MRWWLAFPIVALAACDFEFRVIPAYPPDNPTTTPPPHVDDAVATARTVFAEVMGREPHSSPVRIVWHVPDEHGCLYGVEDFGFPCWQGLSYHDGGWHIHVARTEYISLGGLTHELAHVWMAETHDDPDADHERRIAWDGYVPSANAAVWAWEHACVEDGECL